jgi:glycosyltransferase involved in cell wall biosynthesis
MLGVRKTRRPVIVTNMDGLEYNRSKWSYFTQRLIRVLERIAVRDSPHMISDNLGIQEYYRKYFGKDSFFLPYGADPVTDINPVHLGPYGVTPHNYLMLVARFEPENNLETALEGFLASGSKLTFMVVGNHQTRFGRYLKAKFADDRIRFTGGIYSKPVLDSLRHHTAAYIHGHSVGGTNPSLLEAMACGSFILAHDNPFNRNVLFDAALYFRNSGDVKELLLKLEELRQQHAKTFEVLNTSRIQTEYNWDSIVDRHESLFEQLVSGA